MKKIQLFLAITFCAVLNITAQNAWLVPQEQKDKLSPVEFTKSMQQSGEEIFTKNCVSCHGTPGQGNYNALLNPSPGDPADEKYQSNTDGELYYKISEGRVTMPSFKSALSKDDIWNIIAYVRSFNPAYVQETAEKVETNIPEGTKLALDINFNDSREIIEVSLMGKLNNETNPIGGVAVKLFAKRYFGKLPIGEAKATNKNGIASFAWDGKLPGDSLGNIEFNAELVDSDIFGEIKVSKTLSIGHATNNPPLNEKRAMWNVVQKAPLWILFGYTGAVITVWFFIFYVLFSVKRIFAVGKEEISDDQKLL